MEARPYLRSTRLLDVEVPGGIDQICEFQVLDSQFGDKVGKSHSLFRSRDSTIDGRF
jgi:hypothetical protein